MNKYLIRGALLSVGLISACVGGESASDADDVQIERADQPLYLRGAKWPNGIVPVCWTAKSTARADFASLSAHVRDVLLSTWPRVANVEFTGWGACPSDTRGMVGINLNKGPDSNANDFGYQGSTGQITMDLGVDSGEFFDSVVPHEFGHLLGFAHEMARPDFTDDMTTDCNEVNYANGDYLGTPADRQSIMASTGYCQHNPMLSRWDIVGVRNAYGPRMDNVVSSGTDLYARQLSSGDFYKRIGSLWVRIGSPGGQFVTVGSLLYGLSPDSNDVNQWGGSSSWSKVGGVARNIFRCGTMLCGVHPDDLALYRLNGTDWIRIGDAAADYASTANDLYRLSLDRSAVEKFSDATYTWTQVGGPATALYATQSTVFAVKPSTGELFRYNGTGTSWSFTGGPGDHWVGVGNTLYGLTPSRDSVWKWTGSGSSWTKVGTAADWIYGGPSGSLYATSPGTHTIMRYLGTNMDWVSVGQP